MPQDFDLNAAELRVLGALIEKRFSTPDSYPLTLNALVLACNQSSNRDPVVHLDDHAVDAALKSTRALGYSFVFSGADSRVPRFKENLCEKLTLSRPLAAILAELVLRGPQTPGELRQRTARMYEFPDLHAVEAALDALSDREQPLIVELPRQPGKREIRYAHLLGGEISLPEVTLAPEERGNLESRVAALEQKMAEVVEKVNRLMVALE